MEKNNRQVCESSLVSITLQVLNKIDYGS